MTRDAPPTAKRRHGRPREATPAPHRPRKGASRAADIPADVLAALQAGTLSTATLAEGLAIDQTALLCATHPGLPAEALARAKVSGAVGILRRMRTIAEVLLAQYGPAHAEVCRHHASDTVRGWACFIIGAQPGLSTRARLAAIQPLADDPHFGVREWAWLAVRPALAADLDTAIAGLADWTASPSERIRRFASEALRPRGVWCAHLPALKQAPQRALPILEPLRADPSPYVQDSVGNWLNDAAKDAPGWVRDRCRQWRQASPAATTERICRRGERLLSTPETP
ncbi:DNA alkylation repair protein [Luteimonas sp. RIT-PG2_3]